MAITNQGFPDSASLSPQVVVAVNDNTLLPATVSSHNISLVGFASKGPINVPTVVSSRNELYTKFGFPHPDNGDPHMIYAAELVLQNVSSVTLVRCAQTNNSSDEAAQTASYNVLSAGGPVMIASNTAGSYIFATDQFFRWRLNGVLASKTLVVLAGTYTATTLAAYLNAQLVAADGIQFYVASSTKIGVETTYACGLGASLELVSIQNAMYGPGSVSGLGTLMTPASITGSATKYPNNIYTSAGTYDFTGLTSLNLLVVIDGTDNVAIDGVVQTIDLTSLCGASNILSAIVTYINGLITNGTIPGGFVASAVSNNLKLTTLHSGRDAAILVKSASTASTIFGFSNTTQYGTSPSAVSGGTTYTAGIVTGSSNGTGAITFIALADSPGIEGNNTSITIANSTTGDGTFSIQVLSNGSIVETWSNLTKDQSSTRYIGTYLNDNSNYIAITDNTLVTALPLPGTYTLTGGTDGIPSDPDDQDTILIGNAAALTGMQVLSDKNQINTDIIAVPGHTSTSIATALIALCEQRDDCFGVVDPPFGLTPTEIVQWQNGAHPLNNTRFDSNHAAIFYPWLQYYDTNSQKSVWIPPSGAVASTMAQSDNIGGGPWNAAAGENRGTLPSLITGVYTSPSYTELNSMYGYQNCVNPIINDSVSGITIFGNKTLQREQTALTRINIMRMVFFAKKQIQTFGKSLLFEQHTPNLEAKAKLLATGVLSNMVTQSAIGDYRVVCDSSINTPDVIDRGELRMKIAVQPVHSVEWVFAEFGLFRTGSFTQSA